MMNLKKYNNKYNRVFLSGLGPLLILFFISVLLLGGALVNSLEGRHRKKETENETRDSGETGKVPRDTVYIEIPCGRNHCSELPKVRQEKNTKERATQKPAVVDTNVSQVSPKVNGKDSL